MSQVDDRPQGGLEAGDVLRDTPVVMCTYGCQGGSGVELLKLSAFATAVRVWRD